MSGDDLGDAGFVESVDAGGKRHLERLLFTDSGDVRVDCVHEIAPGGKWIAGIKWDGRPWWLIGPKGGGRRFKTPRAALRAIDKAYMWEVIDSNTTQFLDRILGVDKR